MNDPDSRARSSERLASAMLDHHLGVAGYAAVPGPRPAEGGWRRLYLRSGGDPAAATLCAIGPAEGGWCSLGVELAVRSAVARERAAALLGALAPYEVALDLDAAPSRSGADSVVRIALRVFLDGVSAGTWTDVVANLSEAARVARGVLA